MMYNSYLRSIILYLVVYIIGQALFLEVYDYPHELLMMLMYGVVFIFFVFPVIFIAKFYKLNFRNRLLFAFLDALIYAEFFLDFNVSPDSVVIFYLIQSCCIAFSIAVFGKSTHSNAVSLESNP